MCVTVFLTNVRNSQNSEIFMWWNYICAPQKAMLSTCVSWFPIFSFVFSFSDNHILISALVIASTVILTVLGAVVWFLYKRSLDSGFTTVFSAAPQSPYNDDCVLVVAEENEYDVQFD